MVLYMQVSIKKWNTHSTQFSEMDSVDHKRRDLNPGLNESIMLAQLHQHCWIGLNA